MHVLNRRCKALRLRNANEIASGSCLLCLRTAIGSINKIWLKVFPLLSERVISQRVVINEIVFNEEFRACKNLVHLPHKRHWNQLPWQLSEWFDQQDINQLQCERMFFLARGQLIQVLQQIDVITELLIN